MSTPLRHLYLFLDEAGNLDFSPNGTRYFMLGSVTKERPFRAYQDLTELKYDLIEEGIGLEYFHAAEDKQATRNRVFEIIRRYLAGVRLDAILVEKRKTPPALRVEEHFYAHILGQLSSPCSPKPTRRLRRCHRLYRPNPGTAQTVCRRKGGQAYTGVAFARRHSLSGSAP